MTSQPNILLITTDHFRRDAIGGHTPNLRRLAARGTRFERAHTPSPLCGPGRTAIVTGLLPSQNGVCGNMAEPLREELRADAFPVHLQRAGYRTALVGKHHWIDSYGLERDVTADDEAIRGFGFHDVFQVLDEGEGVHNDDELTHHLRREGRLEQYREAVRTQSGKGGVCSLPEHDYADRFIADNACRWLESHGGERPWYLNVSFVGPHPPFWHPGACEIEPENVPMPVIGAEDTEGLRARRADYLQKCILIDRYIGEILERIDAENTLVVFTADHGDMLGDFGVWDKRHFREQSVGVPLVMAGPGVPMDTRRMGGRVSRDLVSLLDLYPTFLRAAGLDPETAPSFRGRRFGLDLRAIVDPERSEGHDVSYAELGTHAMLYDGAWKLVHDPEQGGTVQLFHLPSDPTEETNLAASGAHEGIRARLLETILSVRIGLSQYTHEKEQQRLQTVRRPRRIR